MLQEPKQNEVRHTYLAVNIVSNRVQILKHE